ncbi:M56 family metallopeptidase [Pedobacter sp. Hv1]|uniref:M56 family metallopeptidase n=1 Tax=Pedobacter sp. Hv1 TaxID=1740090 RepID=UPI0006D8A04D|nr:M56 family metallopeptidase [Pedobacter sp. Hv1]KQC02537.1 hypothetical protein AQF98_02890 [Pedobacter sp. Hv1]
MAWLYYLIEANIYLGIFYAFYYFVLKNETLYVLIRWYLLVTAVLAFVLPLLTVSYTTPISQPIVAQSAKKLLYDVPLIAVADKITKPSESVENDINFTFDKLLFLVYGAVVLLFCCKLLFHLYKIVSIYRRGEKEIQDDITFIKLPYAKEEVFSFFSWLFLHPNLYQNRVIIAHEKMHIRQGHSYDVLFFELLCCLNWFNPLLYQLFSAAKLNHEYIADQETSTALMNKYDYANLLIQHAYVPREPLSHSAFTQTQLEQRIKQLGRPQSKRKVWVKCLVLFPMVGLLFFISAFKVEKSYGLINFVVGETVKPQTRPSRPIVSLPNQKELKVAPEQKIIKKVGQQEDKVDSTQQVSTPMATNVTTSELITGVGVLNQIAVELAAQGKKLYAREYMLYWTTNKDNLPIRKAIHGVLSGTEAQLFRGIVADTLYIDEAYYKIKGNVVEISTDNLMVGYADGKQNDQKKLVVVNALKRKIVHTLNNVDIRTWGTIYKVIANPDYGYVKKETKPVDTLAIKYVDMKVENAKFKYIMVSLNSRVREAKITANEIITNETKIPKEDPWQPGIIW